MVCLTVSALEPNSAWPGAENEIEAAFRQETERKGGQRGKDNNLVDMIALLQPSPGCKTNPGCGHFAVKPALKNVLNVSVCILSLIHI